MKDIQHQNDVKILIKKRNKRRKRGKNTDGFSLRIWIDFTQMGV